MLFRSLALSATVAALALAPSVQAATAITLVSNGNVLTADFGASHTVTGTFSDEFTFTVPTNTGADVLVATVARFASANIDFDPLLSSFDGSPFDSYQGPGVIEALNSFTGPLTPGPHSMIIAGNLTGSAGSYSGTLNIYAVPEVATWVMMIAGFGLAGVALRRRAAAARSVAVKFV